MLTELAFMKGIRTSCVPFIELQSKVNRSVYIAQSGQRQNITLNNFFLHVLNQALKRFLIEVFLDFIN